ncbi:MAG: M28 family peptidase [Victivallales bacterium]|nr:M28 family peptidase [Victivallales bacterium]
MSDCLRIFLLAALLMIFFSCSVNDPEPVAAPAIDETEAFELLKEGASIVPRHSGTPGAEKTVEFISNFIAGLGVVAELDRWVENTPDGMVDFCNVVARIEGKDKSKSIIVACHYDTKRIVSVPDFVGANDGASGVAVLLSMIKAIVNHPSPPPATLKFVFFDGEECFIEYTPADGLFGSRRMAAELERSGRLEDCLAVVVLDLVGDKDLEVTIPTGADKRLVDLLFLIASRQDTRRYFTMFKSDIIDDHTPFQQRGVPTLDMIDFEYGPGNRYWHTSADTVDKTSAKSLCITGNAALQLIWEIPSAIR